MTPGISEELETKVKEHLHNLWVDLGKPPVRFKGGCIASLIQGETPNDYDMYDTVYHGQTTDKVIKGLQAAGARLIIETDNAHTLSFKGKTLQLIKLLNPQNITNFDFKHTMNSFNPEMYTLKVLHPEHVVNKVLEPARPYNNLNAIYRAFKFLERGYKLPSNAAKHKFVTDVISSFISRNSCTLGTTEELDAAIQRELGMYGGHDPALEQALVHTSVRDSLRSDLLSE